jgi:hypothetical protein
VAEFILSVIAVIRVFFRSRSDTALEVLAVRPASCCAQRQTSPASIELPGPSGLDDLAPFLASLDRRPRHRETRNRCRLAPRRLSPVLALAVPATGRPTQDHRGDPCSDPTLGAEIDRVQPESHLEPELERANRKAAADRLIMPDAIRAKGRTEK